MKVKKLLLSILTILSLSSCNFGKKNEPEVPKYSIEIIKDKYFGYEKNISNSKRQTEGKTTITVYGINDFHGHVFNDEDHIGIAKVASFAKQELNKENTLFIDSGDAYQGTLESNSNYGKIIADCYNEAEITAMTIGNHDFDWGLNELSEHFDYSKFPILGANICDYDPIKKENGTIHEDELCYSYMTTTLENGLKVGIIGTIGENQITTITSNIVEKIAFNPQIEYIKNISDYLRKDRNCDVIISSSHSYYIQDMNAFNSLTETSPVTNKRYVDLVLNGHAHSRLNYKENGVNFVQTDSDGQNIEKIVLTYDYKTEKIDDASTKLSYLYNDDIDEELTKNDDKIESICEKYTSEYEQLHNQILSENFVGTFKSNEEIPNLLAESIYKECIKQNINVDMAVVNYGRNDITKTTLTYGDLFECLPFDNEVHILEVSGYDTVSTLINNFTYSESSPERNSRKTYKIAVIDYVAYQVDTNRNNTSFNEMKYIETLEKDDIPYIYRDILKDYLLDNKTKIFDSKNYKSTLPYFSF